MHPEDPIIVWNPTPEYLARFLAREVAMCARERARRPKLRVADTLFGIGTWVKSTAFLEVLTRLVS